MKTPLQITFRDMPSSDALDTHIREKAQKLEQAFSDIVSCRVVVDQPAKHQQQGKLFNVRIDLGVPGKQIVVDKQENEDAYVALRDAFDAARRQLEDYARQL
ncbi:MAG: RNA polymerase subunit sigma-54 [Thiobacillus sp. 63-78]|uniref:HPF/RaiA family ribosome-associated protein n=1 Tax=Thiobacillus sp. 63-78 TaxID=1895859 RepID=UPI0009597962|nr:HPF/RaiA family ribosome-associated protein [Thiobacillus sp. 63-78]MBN8774878.1 ribosome-associated translation inhibitor RaiA [Thiobacillus sp.]OJZ16517.1 MAG: RNA polymerase subunit sigma-54 [Thiobacillus sp. 63-78]